MEFSRASANERRFLPPAVAVSSVAFALTPPAEARKDSREPVDTAVTLWIPLVRRTRPPFEGIWALPGGPIPWDEALVDTALRTLHAAVHRAPGYLEQLYSFGEIERSAQAQRLVTIAYWALYGERELAQVPSLPERATAAPGHGSTRRWDDPEPPQPPQTSAERLQQRTTQATLASADSLDADRNVAWFSADRLPELAFDHADIVATALWRLRSKTEYSALAHRFLGPTFTLAQLRVVHEAILGEPVDPANFRRQALAQGNLIDTGETTTGTGHRPARLYRFRSDPGAPDVGARPLAFTSEQRKSA
ncbi:NrtR DNA-binding winged helix domain-containing protein [Leucobacter sp. W1038]|uniref:NUDIX hydrolase n=1 Tax=Leucobacter sp. W1038 TaxID=3438281 RepID=UPI003D95D012